MHICCLCLIANNKTGFPLPQLCQISIKFEFYQRFQCPDWWAVRHTQSPAKHPPPHEPFHHPGVQDFSWNHFNGLGSADGQPQAKSAHVVLVPALLPGAQSKDLLQCSWHGAPATLRAPEKQILAEKNHFLAGRRSWPRSFQARAALRFRSHRNLQPEGINPGGDAVVQSRFGEDKPKIKQRFAASFYQTSSVWCVCKAPALVEWHMSFFPSSREGAQGKEVPVWQILTFPVKQWIAWLSY